MANTQKYINHLLQNTGITPACSEEERLAAEDIAKIFRNHGFEPEVQEFTAPPSNKLSIAIMGILAFVGALFLGFGGIFSILGVIFALLAAIFYGLEYTGHPFLSRLGAAGISQNVIAHHKAEGPLASPRNRPVVVVAHYDSPRVDLMSQEPYVTYRAALIKALPITMMIPAVAAIVRLLPVPGVVKVLLWLAAIVASLVPLVFAVNAIAGGFVLPFTSGAVGNKSSVAAMLGVMDAVAPFKAGDEFPNDLPFDQYFGEQKRRAEEMERALQAELGADEAVEDGAEADDEQYEYGFEEEPVADEDEPLADESVDDQLAAAVHPVAAPAVAPVSASMMDTDALQDGFDVIEEAAVDATVPADEAHNAPEPVMTRTEYVEEVVEDEPGNVNVNGNLRYGKDIVTSLGMLPTSCAVDYEDGQMPEPVKHVIKRAVEVPVEVSVEETHAVAQAGDAFEQTQTFEPVQVSDETEEPEPKAEEKQPLRSLFADDKPSNPFVDFFGMGEEEQADLPEYEPTQYSEEEQPSVGERFSELGERASGFFGSLMTRGKEAVQNFKDAREEARAAREAEAAAAAEAAAEAAAAEAAAAEKAAAEKAAAEAKAAARAAAAAEAEAAVQEVEEPVAAQATEPIVADADDEPVAYDNVPADETANIDMSSVFGNTPDDDADANEDEPLDRPAANEEIEDYEDVDFIEAEYVQLEDDEEWDSEQVVDASETAVFEAQRIEDNSDSTEEAVDEQDANLVSAATTIVSDEPLVTDDMISTESELEDGWTTAFEPLADTEQVESETLAEESFDDTIETETSVEEETAAEAEITVEDVPEQSLVETFESAAEYDTVFNAEPDVALQADEEQVDFEPVQLDPDVSLEFAPLPMDDEAVEDESAAEYDSASRQEDAQAAPADEPKKFSTQIFTIPTVEENNTETDLGATVAAPPVDDGAIEHVETENGQNDEPGNRVNPAAAPRLIAIPDPSLPSMRQSSNASRAALFDLPDPSAGVADPLGTGSYRALNSLGSTQPAAPLSGTERFEVISADAAPLQSPIMGVQHQATETKPEKKKGFLSGLFGRKKKEQQSMSDWLGVDEEFDAKNSGRNIGSWDNFEDGDGDWKGGAATSEEMTNEEMIASVASMGDDELLGHDIWFVATGASECDNAGMRAFLDTHRDKLRGVFFINLESVGAGQVSMIASEGANRTIKGDRRIMNLIGRVSSKFHAEYPAVEVTGTVTDAHVVMESSLRALTVAGVDGPRIACTRTDDDLPHNIQPENIAMVSEVVAEVIRRS